MMENPEPPHPPHRSGGPKWLDTLQTVTLVCVSVASLYFTATSGGTMERLVQQNERLVRASSTPILQFGHGNAGESQPGKPPEGAITFSVENVGTGPARVQWFEVRYGGKPMASFNELLRAVDPVAKGAAHITTTTTAIAPTMMAAGEDRTIVTWVRPPASDIAGQTLWNKMDKARWELKIEACYCSVFEECWTTSAHADIPKPVKSCTPEGRISFDG